jgi:hypothetical protein
MAGAESLLNVVTTTLNAWSEDVYDNVTNNNALLYYFKKFGKLGLVGEGNVKMGSIETRSGGKQIEEDISIKENSNVGFVAYNETVGTDAVDVLNQAIFNWKYCYGNAVLYGAEIDMAADSKYRKHKLVENIVLNAEETMVNKIGEALFNTSDADSIDGLPALITDDGTGTVGGISTTAYPKWANKYKNVAANPTASVLLQSMAELYRDCTRGKSSPDIIVTTPALYSLFESALTPQQRFTNSKLADAGFEALKFHGAEVIFDESCPANRMYMLNTRAIVFNFHKDQMFKVGKMEKLFGQEKYAWPITAMCNFSVRSRRDLGVLVVAAS